MLDQVDDSGLDRILAKRQEKNANPTEEPKREMTFLEHLEALRWHLFRACVAIVILSIVAFSSKSIVFGMVILGPSKVDFLTFQWLCKLGDLVNTDLLCIKELPFTIQSRQLTGQFTMHLMSSFVVGFVVGFPYLFWEIWRFIKPALYDNEKNVARGTTFFVSVLFFIGISFGYFVITPLSINFLGHYTVDDSIINEFDLTSYVNTVIMLVLACGIMFQLPMFAYFFSKLGVLHPAVMKRFRKHAIVTILFISAVITPPDVLSQVLVTLPVYGLYELSIRISARVVKKQGL